MLKGFTPIFPILQEYGSISCKRTVPRLCIFFDGISAELPVKKYTKPSVNEPESNRTPPIPDGDAAHLCDALRQLLCVLVIGCDAFC